MKTILCITLILAASASIVLAQGRRGAAPTDAPRPTVGIGSKTMESCRQDIQRYCATASAYIQKECLVQNWNNISSDCQDAVATPSRGAGGG